MGIEYHYENSFQLVDEQKYTNWIMLVCTTYNIGLDRLVFVFCDDDYLLHINQTFLKHTTLTDIITFDYATTQVIHGDIFISTQRVKENAIKYEKYLDNEMLRVMAHGMLHLLGFNDKTDEERVLMREKEEETIQLFHVERRYVS